ncbi:MAG TPA: hypothetical protein VNS19_04650 [Acidimicrobiales bacterium]|nr:hypothetical protein [Acidimicrobiales bacterium]
MVLRRTRFLLLLVVALASCSADGDRRMFAEQFELPRGYEPLNRYEHLGEVGKIGGRPIDITVARPEAAGPADIAAMQLCDGLAGDATVEHEPHEVPADWGSCQFRSLGQRVLVGTYDRFRDYDRVLADDACGRNRCRDDDLVVWIE